MAEHAAAVVETTERYYDSDDADAFYARVWGGEDIHIGIYESPDEDISRASRRTVERMAKRAGALRPLDAATRVLDLGAGYGGAARWLAARFGCRVTCVNLSETQNERNRRLCREQGLGDRVAVRHANFEAVPEDSEAFDLVWSQDAFLHSGRRERVLEEAQRLLAPGGQLVFTDPMQADDCPSGVLAPVYERIHLDSMGSFAFYREAALRAGLEEVGCLDLTPHLRTHYDRVRRELAGRYDELSRHASAAYLDRMLRGLGHWVDAADRGHLRWGILQFRKI